MLEIKLGSCKAFTAIPQLSAESHVETLTGYKHMDHTDGLNNSANLEMNPEAD